MKALLLATLLLSITSCDDGTTPSLELEPTPPLWVRLINPDTALLAKHPRVETMSVQGKQFWFYRPPSDSGYLLIASDTLYIGMRFKRYDTSESILLAPSRAPRSDTYKEFAGVVEYMAPAEEDQ